MSITQETAILVDLLATAASKIGSTAASAKINQLIVDILPNTHGYDDLLDALRQDNAALQEELKSLQTSEQIKSDNLEVLRGKLAEINSVVSALMDSEPSDGDGEQLARICDLSEPIEA